jgi:hypothetical protein
MNHPLTALRVCADKLASAVAEADAAATLLTDARRSRALELAETIRAAHAMCGRLAFAVEADAHSAAHEKRVQR